MTPAPVNQRGQSKQNKQGKQTKQNRQTGQTGQIGQIGQNKQLIKQNNDDNKLNYDKASNATFIELSEEPQPSIELIKDLVKEVENGNDTYIYDLTKNCWNYIETTRLELKPLVEAISTLELTFSSKLSYLEAWCLVMDGDPKLGLVIENNLDLYKNLLAQIRNYFTIILDMANEAGLDHCKLINLSLDKIDRVWLYRAKELFLEMQHTCDDVNNDPLQTHIASSTLPLTIDCVPKPEISLSSLFRFILQILDQGNVAPNPKALRKLYYSLKCLQNHTKYDIYVEFNGLNSKISFITMLIYLNYLISKIIMDECMEILPKTIQSKFRYFSLPPLSPPEEYTFGDDQNFLSNDDLIIVQYHLLQLIKNYISEELNEKHRFQLKTSSKIVERAQTKLYDTTLASIVSSLICIDENNSEVVISCQSRLMYCIIDIILQQGNQAWIAMLNLANDICYSDLRYIKVFINLFHNLMEKNNLAWENVLVRSGLDFFINTFKPGHDLCKSFIEDDETCLLDGMLYRNVYEL